MSCDKNHISDDMAQEFWEWRLTNAPEYATSLGIHKYDDRLDELNLNAFSRFQAEAKNMLDKVKEIITDSTGMSDDRILNLELIVADLEQMLYGLTFKSFLLPISSMNGPHYGIPFLLATMKTDSVEDIAKILSRLRQSQQQIEGVISLLAEGLRLGLVHHKVSVEKLPQILKDLAETPVEKSRIFKAFVNKPEYIDPKRWSEIVEEAKEIIQTKVNPSFMKLREFLCDEYLPCTRESIAMTSLPRGREYYAACLHFHTTTDLTAHEIHDIGLSEVARIKGLMEEVKERVAFQGTLKEFLSSLLEDKRFEFSDGDEILDHYKKIVQVIDKKISQYFHTLPTLGFDILPPKEPSLAAMMPAGWYIGPWKEGGRGVFYVNTSKPEIRKKYDALALSLHEAIPGHHLQFALTIEASSIPDFRRLTGVKRYPLVPGYFAMNTGYLEGWGLYAEYLGEEMGLYADPYDMLGRLQSEMLRSCRLVVDTGMHALGWSRDAAVEYMCENNAMALHQIEMEINRYIGVPGQACGYKIGELKIKELRKRAEDKLGEYFDLKMFHHLVATLGPVPLNVLEKKVELFIEQQHTTVSANM